MGSAVRSSLATRARAAAFRACEQAIERLKEDAPIWKREHGEHGPHWIGWQDVRAGGDGQAEVGHLGADAVGLNFVPGTPRALEESEAADTDAADVDSAAVAQ